MHGISKQSLQKFDWEDPFLLDEQLTEDERMIRDTARDYAQEKLMPRVTEAYAKEKTDREIFNEMGQLGLLGVTLPEEYGCANASYVAYGLVAREIERVDSGYRSMNSVQSSLVIYPIYAYGTEEQRKKYLEPYAAGETVSAIAISEPGAGGDPAGVRFVTVNYPGIVHDVSPGATVLVDNGLIRLEVLACDDATVHCRVVIPGTLTSRRHIYQRAKPLLGQRNLAAFVDWRAVVDVGALTGAERAQILYNHVAFGGQAPAWKASVKPCLDAVAEVVGPTATIRPTIEAFHDAFPALQESTR